MWHFANVWYVLSSQLTHKSLPPQSTARQQGLVLLSILTLSVLVLGYHPPTAQAYMISQWHQERLMRPVTQWMKALHQQHTHDTTRTIASTKGGETSTGGIFLAMMGDNTQGRYSTVKTATLGHTATWVESNERQNTQEVALKDSEIAGILGDENMQKLTYLLMQPTQQHELLLFQAIGALESGGERESALKYITAHLDELSLFEMAMVQGLHPTKQIAQALEKRFTSLQQQTPEPPELSVFLSIASLAEGQTEARSQEAQTRLLLTTLEKLASSYPFQLDELVTMVVISQKVGLPEHTLFWQHQLFNKLDTLGKIAEEEQTKSNHDIPASTSDEENALLAPEHASEQDIEAHPPLPEASPNTGGVPLP
jgi:hypothetical protein